MKPQRFEIGQAVALKHGNAKISNSSHPRECSAPLPSVIYHVAEYFMGTFQDLKGKWLISLKEIDQRNFYNEDAFEPVEMTSEEIQALTDESISVPIEK